MIIKVSNGFTLLEVLIALVVCVLLLGTAGSALITILTAEETASASGRAALLIPTVACRVYLQNGTTGVEAVVGTRWDAARTEIDEPATTNLWHVWTFSPAEGRGPQVVLPFLDIQR